MAGENEKRHTCKQCTRKFTTQQSLQQHRNATLHSTQPVQPAGGARPKKMKKAKSENYGPGFGFQGSHHSAPVARGISLKAARSTSVFPFRTFRERVKTVTVTASDATEGKLVFELTVAASITKRMAVLTRAFQRIRFLGCTLHIVSKASTSIGGGIIAAFVQDINDNPSLDTLGCFQDAKSITWWDSMNVHATIPKTLYYTEPTISNDRFWSPGKFVVLVDGKPSADVTLTFHITVTVEFSGPGLEDEVSVKQYVTALPLKFDAGTAQLVGLNSDGAKEARASRMIAPKPVDGTVFRVRSYQMEYSEGSGDTGTVLFDFLIVKSGAVYPSLDGKAQYDRAGWVWQSDVKPWLVIGEGEPLEVWGAHRVAYSMMRTEFNPSTDFRSTGLGRPFV
uniref:Capsid protein n=1 Tax=Khabarov virus TaxID=2707228 RepID=A0A6H0DIF9_9VIRU|nr:MAG: capsid protein [Khabarov virus]